MFMIPDQPQNCRHRDLACHGCPKKQKPLFSKRFTKNNTSVHKPCSVPADAGGSYLSMRSAHPPFRSVPVRRFPYQIWVSRLRGLPVPPVLFPERLRLCGTFKDRSPWL